VGSVILDKVKLLDMPPPIYYPFTDPFTQRYYKYTLKDLQYLLKLSLLLGEHVEITAANLWQSSMSMDLFNSAKLLFDYADSGGSKARPLIRLATRKYENNSNVFLTYFDQRLDERGHFIALPGDLLYLDFQLPETRKTASYLDGFIKPHARRGGDVTELYTKYILDYFVDDKIYFLKDRIQAYGDSNSISRATVAESVLYFPFDSNKQERLILDSNEIYFRANAVATKAQLIYPKSKNNIILYKPTFNQEYSIESAQKIIDILNSVNLSYNILNSISLSTFFYANNHGVLDNIKRYIWALRACGNNTAFLYSVEKVLFQSLCKRSVNLLIDLNRNNYHDFNENIELYDIELQREEITKRNIFNFNMNRTLYFEGAKKMKEQNVKLSTLIEECNVKLKLDELKNIAVEIFDDYEFISHSNKLEFVRELCLECKRKGRVEEFIHRCMKYNASFTILPISGFVPSSIVDWHGSDGIGETVSEENQEKIIGDAHRFQSIAFLEKGFEVAKRICMLVNNKESFRATGFLVNKAYILTNKHVIASKEIASGTEVWLNYEEGTTRQSKLIKLNLYGDEAIISEHYDMALCRIKFEREADYFDTFPTVQIGMLELNDIVPIIQHPTGMPKQVCIGHNSLVYIDDERIQYLTDTMPGSSGAPVFNSSWNLIGLHSKGGWIAEPRTGQKVFRNEGIHINIIKRFLLNNNIELI
jgi:hypothetical protein